MEEMDTSYFCEFLKQNGISEHVVAVFREEDISGIVFPDLTKEDLKQMGLKMGDKKLLLQLQEKHMPEKTLVSHAHYSYYHYLFSLRQMWPLVPTWGPLYPNLV